MENVILIHKWGRICVCRFVIRPKNTDSNGFTFDYTAKFNNIENLALIGFLNTFETIEEFFIRKENTIKKYDKINAKLNFTVKE